MANKKIQPAMIGQGADYIFNRHFLRLPKGFSLDDVMEPSNWGPVVQQNLIQENDLIRIRAHDGSFDLQFNVVSVTKGAINLELWPKHPSELEMITAEREKLVVPVGYDGRTKVRVEPMDVSPFSNKQTFRVIAINGEELSQHPTEAEAAGAMAAYLFKIGYRLPSEEEMKVMMAELQAKEDERIAKVAETRNKHKGIAPQRKPASAA